MPVGEARLNVRGMVARTSPGFLVNEELSPLWEAMVGAASRTAPWRRALATAVAPRANDTIVMIGDADVAVAKLLLDLAPMARVVVVSDYQVALDDAREALAPYRRRVAFVSGDARDLPRLVPRSAPTKVVGIQALRLHAHNDPLDVLDAVRETLQHDGAFHLVEHGAQGGALMRSLLRASHGLEPSNGLVALVRQAGFVAVDESQRFATLAGTLSLISARMR